MQAKPQIRLNYLSTDEDVQTAAESIEVTRSILRQKAFTPYCPEEYMPGHTYRTRDELIMGARSKLQAYKLIYSNVTNFIHRHWNYNLPSSGHV